MDKVELKTADVTRLLEWRDAHKDEVRANPSPMRAVDIRIVETQWSIKGIRDGDRLTLYPSQAGMPFGNCRFSMRADGMWVVERNKTGMDQEQISSILTVYCSLMALMVHRVGYVQPEDRPDKPKDERKPGPKEKKKDRKRKPTGKPTITYILKSSRDGVTAVPKGSHASPSGIFTVRGHWRYYRNGKRVWIEPYRKGTGKSRAKTYRLGKDGQPISDGT